MTQKAKTVSASSKKKLTKANTAATTQKVVSRRELKYIYPKGMTDTLKRKAFRQKHRDAANKMELAISKLKGQEKKEKKVELDKYRASYFTKV